MAAQRPLARPSNGRAQTYLTFGPTLLRIESESVGYHMYGWRHGVPRSTPAFRQACSPSLGSSPLGRCSIGDCARSERVCLGRYVDRKRGRRTPVNRGRYALEARINGLEAGGHNVHEPSRVGTMEIASRTAPIVPRARAAAPGMSELALILTPIMTPSGATTPLHPMQHLAIRTVPVRLPV